MLDNNLWSKILAYDFDKPLSEYGFSTRLAKDNYWTKNFTKRAVLEYRKFMYLAAKSDMMVSPSPIVDIVWHEHLTFTKSYQEFCDILGKQIQHVPSTHSRDDFEKFKAAKERTLRSYVDAFGMPPEDLWIFPGMYESLRLKKAKFKLRSFTLAGLLVLAALMVPAYFLLRPLYVQINSFGWGYFFLGMFVVIWFPIYNRTRRRSIVGMAHPQSFIFDLHPMEVVYLKTSSIERVIDGTLNKLLVEKKITANEDRMFLEEGATPATPEEFGVIDMIEKLDGKSMTYEGLIRNLKTRPPFANIEGAMEALNKYVVKSKAFGKLFYLNFAVMGLVFLLGFSRIATGLMRDRPVVQITMLVCFFLFLFAIILYMLTQRAVSQPLDVHYTDKVKKLKGTADDEWEWKYAVQGNAVLMPAMLVLASRRDSAGSSSDSSSSDSSSSDSSCGSSCGGCGGGD